MNSTSSLVLPPPKFKCPSLPFTLFERYTDFNVINDYENN